jgi:hypothetical protein
MYPQKVTSLLCTNRGHLYFALTESKLFVDILSIQIYLLASNFMAHNQSHIRVYIGAPFNEDQAVLFV